MSILRVRVDRSGPLRVLFPMLILLACNATESSTRGGAMGGAKDSSIDGTRISSSTDSISQERVDHSGTHGKPEAPVVLDWQVPTEIELDTPFEVVVKMQPRRAADSLTISMVGMTGLAVLSDAQIRFEQVESGSTLVSTVELTASSAGILYLGVVARFEAGGRIEGRSFSIPIAVGEQQPARRKSADEAGRRDGIRSMPAVEEVHRSGRPPDGSE